MAVACEGRLAAVADGPQGLAVIDLSDPPAAQIIHQIPFGSDAIAVAATLGNAYVALRDRTIVRVQMETVLELGRLNLATRADDLVLAGNFLYAHEADFGGRVSAIPLNGPFAVAGSGDPASFTSGNNQRQRVFAGGESVYSAHQGGYSTFDITDPANPVAIATGNAGQFGWRQIVLNGSGLGVAAVGLAADDDPANNHIHLYDTSDPTQTTNFLGQVDTPGTANAVSIFNGLAYVADGAAGMQAVNYLSFDTMKEAPTVQLVTNFSLGFAEEGQIVTVSALVDDDVQVRNVEFYLNGELASTDGNFPFEFRFLAPLRSEQASVTVQARATDTGGNVTTTNQMLTLTDDATPPQVIAVAPSQGSSSKPGSLTSISVFFDEPILVSTLGSNSFQLMSAGPDRSLDTPDDIAVRGGSILFDSLSRTARMVFSTPLSSGLYRAQVTNAVTDLKGNPLASTFNWTFMIESPQVTGTTPAHGAIARAGSVSTILGIFDVDMDRSTISGTSFRLFTPGNDGDLGTEDDTEVPGGAVDYQDETRTARIVFPSALAPGDYRAVLAGSIQDLFGDSLSEDFEWTFTVEAPRVLAVSPPNGSLRGESRIFQIQATFSAELDANTLTPSTFRIFAPGLDEQLNTGDDFLIEATSVYFNPELRRAYLTLPGTLPISEYRGEITSAVADTQGNHLSSDFNWTFSVIEAPYEQLLFDRPSLQAGASAGDTVIADFNLDGIADLAVASAQENSLRVYFGVGGGAFRKSTVDFDMGIPAGRLVVADFNLDGFPDIAGAQNAFFLSGIETISVILNQGDETFASPSLYESGMGPFGIAAGDLDGDGDPDLAVTNTVDFLSSESPGDVRLLINRGDGVFDPGARFPVGYRPTGILIQDFDRDGDNDLALTNGGDLSVTLSGLPLAPGMLFLFRNNGSATFTGPESYPVGVNPLDVASGDLNGDGRLDLVVANDGYYQGGPAVPSSYSILLATDGGLFASPTSIDSATR
ncbi:MAG: VCBS repeat-containing protein, partial [Candidatus Omnitrophica bacterium]|nr:VCBS repeat-containing protein [Candidatus Omnitrophota bacterium]